MCRIIYIEGNIGAGKSTLVNSLQAHMKSNKNIHFIQEPVNDWKKQTDEQGINILDHFYQDTTRWAFVFQINALFTRIDSMQKYLSDPKAILVVERSVNCDRFVFGQMLFDQGFIDQISWDVYKKLYNCYNQNLDSITIYLDVDPVSCLDRIQTRGRVEEKSITLEYLETLEKYHKNMLQNSNRVHILDSLDHVQQVIKIINLD